MLPSQEMKKLEIIDYVNIVKRRLWMVILIMTVAAILFVMKAVAPIPTLYRSTGFFIIGEHPAASSVDLGVVKGPEENLKTKRDIMLRTMGRPEFALRVASHLEGIPIGTLLRMVQVGPVRTKTGKVRKASLINQVVVTGKDPVLVAKVANAYLEEIVRMDVEAKQSYSEYGSAWLANGRDEIAAKLQKAESQLRVFEQANEGIAIRASERRTLRKKRIALRERINNISLKYKEKHPEMVAAKRKLVILEQQIDEIMASQPEGEKKYFEYTILKQQVALSSKLYKQFSQATELADIRKDFTLPGIQVVSGVTSLGELVYTPKVIPFSILFGGLLIGVAFCFLLEYLDTSIRMPEEVEFYTNMPFLGEIPAIPTKDATLKDRVVLMKNSPACRVSDDLRYMKVSMLFAMAEGQPLQTVLVASAVPDEGKTIIASNLAISFAQSNEKTLLINGQVGKNEVIKSFRPPGQQGNTIHGLTDLINGKCLIGDAVSGTLIPGLDILGSGTYVPNATDLLTSDYFRRLIDSLKADYQRIVINSQDIESSPQAVILGNHTDGVLFVISSSDTSLKLIREGKRKLEEGGVNVLGAVLNHATPNKDFKYCMRWVMRYALKIKTRVSSIKKASPIDGQEPS